MVIETKFNKGDRVTVTESYPIIGSFLKPGVSFNVSRIKWEDGNTFYGYGENGYCTFIHEKFLRKEE